MTDYIETNIEVFDEKTLLLTIDRNNTVIKQYLNRRQAESIGNQLLIGVKKINY